MKSCSKCKEIKPISEFSKDRRQKSGLSCSCKICVSEYHQRNSLRLSEQSRRWQKDNPEKARATQSKWRKKNSVRLNAAVVKRRKDNNITVKRYPEYQKQYEIANREKRRQYRIDKLINDPLFAIACRIRSRIRHSLKSKGFTKNTKTSRILGCTFDDLKNHLENKFIDGMSWDNMNKWHIDHIIPVSLAKNEEEVIKLNHYSNLQPLWAIDNFKKGNRIKV